MNMESWRVAVTNQINVTTNNELHGNEGVSWQQDNVIIGFIGRVVFIFKLMTELWLAGYSSKQEPTIPVSTYNI